MKVLSTSTPFSGGFLEDSRCLFIRRDSASVATNVRVNTV